MNSELSQNVAASLEGWCTDNWSWQWIDWQYCLALPVMFACISYGVPREKINTALMRDLDWPGIAYAMIGLRAALRRPRPGQPAGLEQQRAGDRPAAVRQPCHIGLHRPRTDDTAAVPEPGQAAAGQSAAADAALAGFRFIILSTAYIIPTYLQTVQNFRELQVGSVLLWIALPQLVIALPLANCCDGSTGVGCWRSAAR